MNSTEANSARLPIMAAVIYLGALFLVLVADPFGSPEKLPRESKNDAPYSEIIGDNEGFGWSVAGGIDIDSDGASELIVSSPMGNEESQYHSQGHFLSPTKKGPIFSAVTSPWPWYSNFSSTAILGDIDKDGTPEVAFGFQGVENNVRRGRVHVVSGKTGELILSFEDHAREEHFGQAVCTIGDLNLDGILDLAVGAPGTRKNTRPGIVYYYSGKDGRSLGELKLSNRSGNRFGYSLAYLGDVNGDGLGEILVGAPGTSSNGYRSGSAFVYTMETGKLLRRHIGKQDKDHLGTDLVALDDHDGDGIGDYAVTTCSNLRESSVQIISGSSGKPIFSAESSAIGDRFGYSLCAVGDMDGDQVEDLAVGAPFAAHKETAGVGYVRLISGRDGSLIRHIRGTEENEFFGFDVAPAGDQNRDGLADVFIASPMSDGRKGRVAIFGIGQAKEK